MILECFYNNFVFSCELSRKQCVRSYSAFDFLTDVVNKVPNLGGTESGGDEKGVARRR